MTPRFRRIVTLVVLIGMVALVLVSALSGF